MPPKLSQNERRRLILSKYKIFHDHASRKAPGHEHRFDNIVQLSQQNVKEYTHDVDVNFNEKPWKRQNLCRAKAVAERVTRSLDERRNEAGWRSHLESWIFHRFEVEVICPECRARLWRSELEAPAADSHLPFSPLERRRSARKPCRCQRHRDSNERYENGLNDIFEDRAEVGLIHEEEIMCQLRKEKEIPDRVWGLRTTQRIDKILSRQRPAGIGSVGDTVSTSPFTGDSNTLLYPFLVLETKSEKSADNFSDINMQTGFTIRTLLNLQHKFVLSLPDHQQASTHNASLPLVWVVSSKGDQWRVSGAYISAGTSGTEYHILDLWDGRLTYVDEALRLILILDYIFDWARDIYRGAIVDGLSSLVQSPSNSLRSDTDVISTREFQKDSIDFRQFAPETDTAGFREFESSDVLRFYDKSGLALRDSTYMSHRVIGLHLTCETLDDFLRSVSRNDEEKHVLAGELFDSLHASKCWSITADCLNELEKVWTNFERESLLFENFQQPFLAFFGIRSHFGTSAVRFTSKTKYDDWVQVHTLNFIAIAVDALDGLRKMLGYAESVHLPSISKFSTEAVMNMLKEIRYAPVRQCLAAAIETRQVSSSHIGDNVSEGFYHNSPMHSAATRWPTMVQTPWAGSKSGGDLPERIYRRLKTGMREPKESFLRVSSFEGEHVHENQGCTFWPGGGLEIGSSLLAVHVSWPQFVRRVGAPERTENCIFLLPPSIHQRDTPGSETNRFTTSAHVLEMKAVAGLLANEPCIEKLCVSSHVKALQILYQVAGCYFEHVHHRPRMVWQQLFREWKLGEDVPRLDFPPEEDQKYCLDTLRHAGIKLGLETKLLILIESFGNALRSRYSKFRPNPQSELIISSTPLVCCCLPLKRWRNTNFSPQDNSRTLSAVSSNEVGESSGSSSYTPQTIDLESLSSAGATENEMSDTTFDDDVDDDDDDDDSTYLNTCTSSSDSDISMDSHEDELMSEDYELTLQDGDFIVSDDRESPSSEGGSIGTVSGMSFVVTGLSTQASIVGWPHESLIIRMSLPPMENVIMAQNPVDQRSQLRPTTWDGAYPHMQSTPQFSPQSISYQTSNLPPSMPSRRIGINDILND